MIGPSVKDLPMGEEIDAEVFGNLAELTIHRPEISVQFLDPEAVLPKYKSEHAAGLDLTCTHSEAIPPGVSHLISTGIAVAIPVGYEGQIRPRSGLALNKGLSVLNTPGTIDSDYRGEVRVLLINHSKVEQLIAQGDRIAQLIIAPVAHATMVVCDALPETTRGDGGFGSTGKAQE